MKCEADLHPVREAFTRLALGLRRKTGLPLEFAHNCTVTERNLRDVPEVLRWFIARPERTRVWRNISFLPEADTGRTRISAHPVTPETVWEKICEGAGVAHGAKGGDLRSSRVQQRRLPAHRPSLRPGHVRFA